MALNHHLQIKEVSEIIGLPVNVGDLDGISSQIMGLINSQEQAGKYICVSNVHMLTLAHSITLLKHVLINAYLVVADGMPLVWSQKLKGFRSAQRVCGPDLMLELCRRASEQQVTIYLLGADELTLDLLRKKLTGLFPALVIAGAYAPDTLPQNPDFDPKVTENINRSGAKILFVGLGCPKQEFWCARHAPNLNSISIGVGAAFDFHAGTKKRPPILVQQLGMEWLYRLIAEPRRLWRRYLTSNTQFIILSIKDWLNTPKQ